MSETIAITQEKGIEKKVCRQVSLKACLPVLGILLALVTEYLIPANARLKNPELPHYKVFLFISLGVVILLFIISIFNEALRERLTKKGAFTCGVFVFLTGLNLVTAKFMLLPQLYFPSIARIFSIFFEDAGLLLTCIQSSFMLLVKGIFIGFLAGMVCGIAVPSI